jgi:hypothetical protein
LSPPHSHDPTVSAASRTSELVLPPTQWSVELVVRVKFRERLAADSGQSHRHRSARFPGQASQGSSRARGVIMPGLHQISTPLPKFFDSCVQTHQCPLREGPSRRVFRQSNVLRYKPIEKNGADGSCATHRGGEAVECLVPPGLPQSGCPQRQSSRQMRRAQCGTSTAEQVLDRQCDPSGCAGSGALAPGHRARERAISRSASAPS